MPKYGLDERQLADIIRRELGFTLTQKLKAADMEEVVDKIIAGTAKAIAANGDAVMESLDKSVRSRLH